MIVINRSVPLLTGLAAGAMLVGALVLVAPAGAQPPEPRPVAAAAVPTAMPRATPVRPTPTRLAAVPPVPPPAPVPTTAPAPPPPPATPAPTTVAPRPTTETPVPRPAGDAMAAVLAATNVERKDAGCAPLEPDSRLRAAAQDHAEDMAENTYFSHTSIDGREFADRIRAAGHPAPGGENIAQGQDSADEVVAAWMDSPGHRRNILDCGFVSLGVGFDDRDDHWVQNFGR